MCQRVKSMANRTGNELLMAHGRVGGTNSARQGITFDARETVNARPQRYAWTSRVARKSNPEYFSSGTFSLLLLCSDVNFFDFLARVM